MVFCTGGRTKSGAERRLPSLPATAFASIGDFIAESLAAACDTGCARSSWPAWRGNCASTRLDLKTRMRTKSVRIWICSVPRSAGRSPRKRACTGCTHVQRFRAGGASVHPRTSGTASSAASRAPPSGSLSPPLQGNSALGLLVFDFEGGFLFEEKRGEQKDPKKKENPLPSTASHSPSRRNRTEHMNTGDQPDPAIADPGEIVGQSYFIKGHSIDGNGRMRTLGALTSCRAASDFRRTPKRWG